VSAATDGVRRAPTRSGTTPTSTTAPDGSAATRADRAVPAPDAPALADPAPSTGDGTDATPDTTAPRAAPDTTAPQAAPDTTGTVTGGGRRRWPTRRRDLTVLGAFLLAALFVTNQIWLNPARRVAPLYTGDPAQVQFFLAHSVRVVLHGEFPFYTQRLNFPDGVNLMANTAILGLGIPMVPVTLLFGPAVSFVVLVTLGLAGTAFAWYWVLSRHLVRTPPAAVVGGWFLGFSPAMQSHANWHPNIISQFLLPFIVWRVMVLTRSTRPVRDGLVLALLVSYQCFINEEILLFTALACGVFLLAVLVQRPGRWATAWRPLAVGLAVCALTASVLLAYPLYVQFAGPQAYHGLSDAVQDYGNDLAAFFNPGSTTLGGNERANADLAPNYSEENAFLGWGLVLLAVAVVVWLRREVVVRALAVTGVVFAVLSCGEQVSYWGRGELWGPWRLLVKAPLLDAVVPTRFGLITTVVVGLLLARAVDRARTLPVADRRTRRAVVATGLAVALVPIAPLPLREVSRPGVPTFITSGQWRRYVAADQTLVPVPVPDMGNTHGMRWAAATELGFRIPGGYFLAPRNGNTGDPGRFGGRPSAVRDLLEEVSSTGRTIRPSERQRRRARDELRYWHAAILVLPVGEHNADALRRTVEQIAGPARRSSDVWLWDVRSLTAPVG
jgi:hypothetical protein